MKVPFRISLKAARVNAGMSQPEVADKLTSDTGIKVSRYRIMSFEKNPNEVPKVFGEKLSSLYGIPKDYLFFGSKSTLSLRHKNKLIAP